MTTEGGCTTDNHSYICARGHLYKVRV